MGMLDQMLGRGMGAVNPFEQYQKMQANPFTRNIPGTEYLDRMQGMNPMENGLGSGLLPQGESVIPTDFAGTPPGLPNLPEDLQGFGFGQSAPKMNINSGLRGSLIQQLISQLMEGMNGGGLGQEGGQQGPMGGMMGGLPMMGGFPGMGGLPGMGGQDGGF